MKLSTWLSVGLLAMGSLTMVACGGDEGSNDNMGGGGPVTNDELDLLKAQIEELKQQIADAAAADKAALEEQLAAAEDKLQELVDCGGNCAAIADTQGELRALTDAYCEQVFGCCTDDEAHAALAPSITDVDSCKAAYAGMIARANSTISFSEGDYVLEYALNNALPYSEALAEGRLAFNTKNLDACVAQIADKACGDADAAPPTNTCGQDYSEPCYDLFNGAVPAGGSCFTPDECVDGTICDGWSEGGNSGICAPQAKVGATCVQADDCRTSDDSLYCDVSEGKCTENAAEGESCAFTDPNFNDADYNELAVPCQEGLTCSPKTGKCVSECEKDALCWGSGTRCGEGLTCNFRANDGELAYGGTLVGFCDTAAANGTTVVASSECASRSVNDSDQCAGNTYCGSGDPCASGEACINGYCFETPRNSGNSCNSDDHCASTALCLSGTCYPTGGSGSACSRDEQCHDTDACMGGSCKAKLALGAPCADVDSRCQSGQCASNGAGYECVALKQAVGEVCDSWQQCASERCDASTHLCVAATKTLGEDCIKPTSLDPCEKGTFCKPNDWQQGTEGVCTAQKEVGSLCDRSVGDFYAYTSYGCYDGSYCWDNSYGWDNSYVPQCEGNIGCSYNAQVHDFVCGIPGSNSDLDKCTLDVPVFDGYGNN